MPQFWDCLPMAEKIPPCNFFLNQYKKCSQGDWHLPKFKHYTCQLVKYWSSKALIIEIRLSGQLAHFGAPSEARP